MIDSEKNWLAIIIGFGIALAFIVSVGARLICRTIEARMEQQRSLQRSVELRSTVHEVEQIVITTVPTTKFNSDDFSSEEDAQCSICLGEYQERDILRFMPKCGHAFHVMCIDRWILKQRTCPICRLSLQDIYDVQDSTFPRLDMAIHAETPPTQLQLLGA
ncbi:RING-H2 finger protein ATL64-like [Nymphaea colorata]|nr:RING-H2 finger protein ATL64-like [Nymphaea colorata]